jgi:hypothetical protein
MPKVLNHCTIIHRDIASIYSEDGKVFYCGLWNGNLMVYNYVTNSSKEVSLGFESSALFAFCKIGPQTMMVGSFGEGAVIINTNTLKSSGFQR